MKRCSKCGAMKSRSEFNKRRASNDGLQHYCCECKREYDRERYAANRERIHEQKREYYAANRECRCEYQREYQKDNRDKCNAKLAKYKARKKKLTPPDANSHIIGNFYRLAKVLEGVTGEKYHVDHIIPLARGGHHHHLNLRVCLAVDNLRKGARI